MKQGVKSGRIRNILNILAKQVRAARGLSAASQKDESISFPTIWRGQIISPEIVKAGREALDQIIPLISGRAAWSDSSIAEPVWGLIGQIMDEDENLPVNTRSEVDRVLQRFVNSPAPWFVDLMVYSFDKSCADHTFGRVQFMNMSWKTCQRLI